MSTPPAPASSAPLNPKSRKLGHPLQSCPSWEVLPAWPVVEDKPTRTRAPWAEGKGQRL